MERKYGSLKSPSDLRDYRIAKAIKQIDMPESFILNIVNIKDQGYVGSCVAHALSSTLENVLNDNFSTGWIYGYRPTGYYQGEGMYPREAIKTLYTMGAVKNADFNINVEVPEAINMVNDELDRLKDCASINKNVTAYARLHDEQEIKTWIYTKHIPVPVSISTNSLKIENNIIQIPTKKPTGGHMMMIVGWNKNGYIVQNSWGYDWGDNGTATLPYKYTIDEAWALTIDENKKDIKKPRLNLLRIIIQSLLSYFCKK